MLRRINGFERRGIIDVLTSTITSTTAIATSTTGATTTTAATSMNATTVATTTVVPPYKNLCRGLNFCLRNAVSRTKVRHLVLVC